MAGVAADDFGREDFDALSEGRTEGGISTGAGEGVRGREEGVGESERGEGSEGGEADMVGETDDMKEEKEQKKKSALK